MNIRFCGAGRLVAVVIFGILVDGIAFAVEPGQIDDFEDNTTQGWSEGNFSPNPPSNIASGGPGGADDNYLENIASGSGGAGGSLVQFNTSQWTGNFDAAGITEIRVKVKVFAGPALSLRIGFRATNETGFKAGYISMAAVAVPADGAWHDLVFPILIDDLVSDGAVRSYGQTMSSVGQMRIMHALAPTWEGHAPIAATVGFDSFEAHVGQAPFQRVLAVPNVGGSAASDVAAVLSGSLTGTVRDATTGELLGAQLFNASRIPLDAGVVQISGSPAIAVLGRAADGRGWVEVRNVVSGALIRDVWFTIGYTPHALAVLPDMNGNNTSEVAVLMTRDSDNDRAWVQIKDSQTLAFINNVWFEAGYTPHDVEYVPNLDGNPGPELAVLMTRDSDNRAWVHLKDAQTGNFIKNIWFEAGYTPKDLAIIDNLDGNPGSEVAVLMIRDSDGRPWVHIKDALSGSFVRNNWFEAGFTASQLAIVANLDANPGDEIAILTTRDSDGMTWVHLKDAFSGAFISKVWFRGDFAPKDFAILPEIDARPGAEVAVLGVTGSGQVQVEIKDAGSLAFINLVEFP